MNRLGRLYECFESACLSVKPLWLLLYLGILILPSFCLALFGQTGLQDPVQSGSSDSRPVRVLIVKSLPYLNSSDIYTGDVVSGCADRLGETHLITVTEGGEMNRKEAADRAKENDGTNVLLIELEPDMADPDRAGSLPLDVRNLIVDYILYEAGTGKVKAQGHTYQRPASSSPGGIGGESPFPPSRSRLGASLPLYRAGREVGDRVLRALDVKHSRLKSSSCIWGILRSTNNLSLARA